MLLSLGGPGRDLGHWAEPSAPALRKMPDQALQQMLDRYGQFWGEKGRRPSLCPARAWPRDSGPGARRAGKSSTTRGPGKGQKVWSLYLGENRARGLGRRLRNLGEESLVLLEHRFQVEVAPGTHTIRFFFLFSPPSNYVSDVTGKKNRLSFLRSESLTP